MYKDACAAKDIALLGMYAHVQQRDVHVQNLLELVSTEMASEHCQADESLTLYLRNTLQHIRNLVAKDDAASEKYRALKF